MRRRWVLRYMWTDPDIIILHEKMYWLGQVNDLVRGRYVRKGHNNVIWKFYFLVIPHLLPSLVCTGTNLIHFTAVLHKHLSKFAPELLLLIWIQQAVRWYYWCKISHTQFTTELATQKSLHMVRKKYDDETEKHMEKLRIS